MLLAAWDNEIGVIDCGFYPHDDLVDGMHFDLLIWWVQLVQKKPKFEPLFIVFMSYFLVTASAAGPERIFRIAGLIGNALRSRLSTEMIRILVFLRKNKDFMPSVEEVVDEYWRQESTKRSERQAAAPVVVDEDTAQDGESSDVESSEAAEGSGEAVEADFENEMFNWDSSEELVLSDIDAALLVDEVTERFNRLNAADFDELEEYLLELRVEND